MSLLMIEYNYLSGSGYKGMAIHAKLNKFDPYNTDNPIILDSLEALKMSQYDSNLYYLMINRELSKYISGDSELPVSYMMVLHKINIGWIDLIHQMIFIENAYNTFYGEYSNVVENILIADSPDVKDALIYRNFWDGISIFHLAGRIWLYDKYRESILNNLNINLDEDLNYILNCYAKLETCFGDDRNYCIRYMTDFTGLTLTAYLQEFVHELIQTRSSQ